jgi:RimJ/RimL family protein N-acetyltransferase
MRSDAGGKGVPAVNGTRVLDILPGPVVLRPEQAGDADFLYTLFRCHNLPALSAMPVDEATRETLIRMQFESQTRTYRALYPEARFDIIERDGVAIGRLVVHADNQAGCIVDIGLLPDCQGAGLGTALLSAVLSGLAGRCPVVRCQVLWNNERSLRMCRRAGFTAVGEQPPFVQLEWRPEPQSRAACVSPEIITKR